MKYLKQIFPYIVTALLAFLLFRSCDQRQEIEESLSSVIYEKDGKIRYFETELGKTVAEKEAAVVSASEAEERYKSEIDQLKRDFNIKIKNLKAVVKAPIEVTGEGFAFELEDPVDSSKVSLKDFTASSSKIYFNDGYLDLDLDPDNLKLHYTYSDTILYAFYTKKKWILGNEKAYGAGSLSNKDAKIVNSTNILIKDYRDKRWSVIVCGYYDPFRRNYGAAIGIGWSLFRF